MCKRSTVVSSLIFTVTLAFAGQLLAQDNKTAYPSMAPLEQYLMDRNAEIALAKSSAPETVSRDATVLVLGRHGYETAVKGTNGFVCTVLRSFAGSPDEREFWNPRIRAAQCLNAIAARTILPFYLKRTGMVLEGMSKAQMIEAHRAANARGDLPPMEPGAMCYMMSKDTYLTDQGSHNMSHVMFYVPATEGATWGSDQPNSQIYMVPQDPTVPVSAFVVAVGRWSDGTPVVKKRD